MKSVGAKLVFAVALLVIAARPLNAVNSGEQIRIGSKKFTESVIIANLAVKLAASSGATAAHRQELGGTRLLWDALLAREIELYPEYKGTLKNEILAGEGVSDEKALERALAARALRMSRPLGFSNAYALGTTAQRAEQLGIAKISDLAQYSSLRFASD